MAVAQSDNSAAADQPLIPIEYIGDRLPQKPSRWPLRPSPMPDELLSSWLNRIAVANGIAPWSFYLTLLTATGSPRNKYLRVREGNTIKIKEVHWVDVSCDKRVAGYLADRSGFDAKLIQGLSLRRPFDASANDRPPNTTLQWALLEVMPELLLPEAKASGTVGGQGYMRFCPLCLAQWRDPWFRKIWRTSLASTCIGHGCYLLSMCSCGADVRPHLSKEVRSQAFCHVCGNDLRSMKTTPACDRDLVRQREMNRRSYEGVEAILALGGRNRRRIVQMITRPTDHLCNLMKTGMMDAYATNSPITLLLSYHAARRRGDYLQRIPLTAVPNTNLINT